MTLNNQALPAEVVGRLRGYARTFADVKPEDGPLPASPLFLTKLRHTALEAAALITSLEAENARLREVVRPFARAADSYDPDEDDGDMDAWDYHPTIGDRRRARTALSPEAS